MAVRLTTAIEHRRRIRRAVRHLEAMLQIQPDARLALVDLADAACLSPYHFIRLYRHAVGETPHATVRRLKLRVAKQLLTDQPKLSITEVALKCGYESAQTFARAYRQQFGCAPSMRGCNGDHGATVIISVVRLPPLRVQAIPVEHRRQGVLDAFDELMAHVDVNGIPLSSQDGLAVLSPDHVINRACIVENSLVRRSLNLPQHRLPGGSYIRVSGPPDEVWRRLQDDAQLTEGRLDEGSLLQRYLNDPAYHTVREQRIELYIPPLPKYVAEIAQSLQRQPQKSGLNVHGLDGGEREPLRSTALLSRFPLRHTLALEQG